MSQRSPRASHNTSLRGNARKILRLPTRTPIPFLQRSPHTYIGTQAAGAERLAGATSSYLSTSYWKHRVRNIPELTRSSGLKEILDPALSIDSLHPRDEVARSPARM